MQEGVEGVVDQSIGPKPETRLEFTPLTKEQLGKLGACWSAGLGGRFLALSRGKERVLDPSQLAKLPSEEVVNYKVFSDASYAERKALDKTPETWEAEMKAWITDNKNPFFLKLIGIGLEQGQELTEKQVDQALKTVKSFFTEDLGQAKIDVFLGEVRKKYATLADLQKDFSSFAAFCHVFGEHAGTAVAHLVGAELGITDESVKQQMGEKINNLDDDEKALLGAIDQLRKEYERLKEKGEITAIPPGEGVKEEKEKVGASLKFEGESMPENAGAKVIANRGKEFDENGQDRVFYKKLTNGTEYFAVCDGAGANGHRIAEFVGKRFAELLEGNNPENLNSEKLVEISQSIQTEALAQFQNSGSTADIVLKLPNNKKFAIHIGEGNIAKIRTAKDFKEGKRLGQGEIFELLFQPHSVTPEDEGAEKDEEGIWRIDKSKTKAFGVPCSLIVDVRELEEGAYLIMSDGLSDLLPFIPYSSVEFMRLYKESPQKAVDYLVGQANNYARETFGKNADDISAVLVNL